MWKVTNKKNAQILSKLRNIIDLLFQEIIYYKSTENSINFHSYIKSKNLNTATKKAIVYLLESNYICGEDLKFSNIIDSILSLDCTKIKEEYKNYTYQNNKLDNLDFDIKRYKNNRYFKPLFTKFLFGVFFNDNNFWECIDSKFNYSKQVFHQNFLEENNLSVCPYCDIDTIIDDSSKDVEHFLPKNSFPYLSMHENNLYSACKSCNCITNKGTKLPYLPFDVPYKTCIGEKSRFSIDKQSNTILLEDNKHLSIENYYKLINLRKRYGQKSVYNAIVRRGEMLYDTISRINNKDDFVNIKEYLFLGYEPLTFAMSCIFESWQDYYNYMKDHESVS